MLKDLETWSVTRGTRDKTEDIKPLTLSKGSGEVLLDTDFVADTTSLLMGGLPWFRGVLWKEVESRDLV